MRSGSFGKNKVVFPFELKEKRYQQHSHCRSKNIVTGVKFCETSLIDVQIARIQSIGEINILITRDIDVRNSGNN